MAVTSCMSTGTSPRVRGKRPLTQTAHLNQGYIPARAGEALAGLEQLRRGRVHPRACGGSSEATMRLIQSQGTSPRVRGKPHAHGQLIEVERYIPARAGEAPWCPPRSCLRRVHPRACGGSETSDEVAIVMGGTSPRVRGKPADAQGSVVEAGYIPARAGEARPKPHPKPCRTVHPRACGGSLLDDPHVQPVGGTSPRVRGKPDRVGLQGPRGGYIPARAGEATPAYSGPHSPVVHPRACGGSGGFPLAHTPREGTSPRVRGKPVGRRNGRWRARYIPARAGEALRGSWRAAARWVHPRACGGSRRHCHLPGRSSGTSPRVRGKPSTWRRAFSQGRYISARAGEAGATRPSRTASGVHPRACGGSRIASGYRELEGGTSPRVRGKPQSLVRGELRRRYIPARAGEATEPTRRSIDATVHPRACGGSHVLVQLMGVVRGTSPRVRGKRTAGGLRHPGLGYIPARAGEARSSTTPPTTAWVHPRACGGSASSHHAQAVWQGTSPRVRGKQVGRAPGERDRGYIPARAGEAPRPAPPLPWPAVHPRACGGSHVGEEGVITLYGTSPRVRGKRVLQPSGDLRVGYIPARAGEASTTGSRTRGTAVHPRACGGSVIGGIALPRKYGTSPRVRGKPCAGGRKGYLGGYIPARAGEAVMGSAGTPRPTVHPRACGGSPTSRRRATRGYGTSPRVRGKHHCHELDQDVLGYIPARAGEAAADDARPQRRGVHPRACGGSGLALVGAAVWAGTSPRVRGKHAGEDLADHAHGYIPARAGEARPARPARAGRRVHPRACGGSGNTRSPGRPEMGTSPRVRGKPQAQPVGRPEVGYIPARAGEAGVARREPPPAGVHPRACGGSAGRAVLRAGGPGTSPRVRGKPVEALGNRAGLRYIPARAGEAGGRTVGWTTRRVHPRACGGSVIELEQVDDDHGTSPRVRGKRHRARTGRRRPRYIPARAGEARPGASPRPARPVHPRACGGSEREEIIARTAGGTSPRVRGKRRGRYALGVDTGYIPARAGEAPQRAGAGAGGRVHPRACGGSHSSLRAWPTAFGTSPRVRGKRSIQV